MTDINAQRDILVKAITDIQVVRMNAIADHNDNIDKLEQREYEYKEELNKLLYGVRG